MLKDVITGDMQKYFLSDPYVIAAKVSNKNLKIVNLYYIWWNDLYASYVQSEEWKRNKALI